MQLYYIYNTYYQIVAGCLFAINYYSDMFWSQLLAIFRGLASSSTCQLTCQPRRVQLMCQSL